MTFFWNNPALVGNPRIKRWVRELLEDRAAVEKAIGMPLREVLGCGHWGCVVDSKRPWVVKFTIDPNEAFTWTKINQLIAEGIYRIEPRVMYGGRPKKAYAIIREEVAPAFTDSREGMELTRATKAKLGLNPKKRAIYRLTFGSGHSDIVVDGERVPIRYPIDEFVWTCDALIKFQRLAYDWHGRQTDRFPQHYPSREHIKGQLERATHRMMGGTGGAIGETLLMLVSNDVVLRDVHLFNVGWRKYRDVPGYTEEDQTLGSFAPGHTQRPRYAQIPVARVANPMDWFQDEKR